MKKNILRNPIFFAFLALLIGGAFFWMLGPNSGNDFGANLTGEEAAATPMCDGTGVKLVGSGITSTDQSFTVRVTGVQNADAVVFRAYTNLNVNLKNYNGTKNVNEWTATIPMADMKYNGNTPGTIFVRARMQNANYGDGAANPAPLCNPEGQFPVEDVPDDVCTPPNAKNHLELSTGGNSYGNKNITVTETPTGGTATASVLKNKSLNCTYKVWLASYKAYDPKGSSNYITNQTLFDSKMVTVPPQSTVPLPLSVSIPPCSYQVDLFEGPNVPQINPTLPASTYTVLNVAQGKSDNLCPVDVPAPTCTLTATPDQITANQNVTLSWTTTNAVSATINNGVGNVSTQLPNGSKTVNPTASTTYTMTVTNSAGQTATCQDSVVVGEEPKTDVSITKSAHRTKTPPNVIIVYTLEIKNNTSVPAAQVKVVDTYDKTRFVPTTEYPVPVEYGCTVNTSQGKIECLGIGTLQPGKSVKITYGLKALNNPGEAVNTAVVSTSTPETTTANNTATETVLIEKPTAAPVCQSFSASPASITAGKSSTLSWQTANATTVTISNGIGTVSASGTRVVTPAQTTTYTLTAKSADGAQDTCQATVTVNPVPALNFSVEKTANPVQPSNGQKVTYTIVVKNLGSTAAPIRLTDELAAPSNGGSLAAIANETVTGGGGVYTGSLAGNGITFSDFPAGATATVTYTRIANTSGIAAGTSSNIVNTAKVWACPQ